MVTEIQELCVIGHPSRNGGADTELDHQIHCWQAMGIEVHLCHTSELNDDLRSMQMDRRGCVYHVPGDWPSLEGLHCISFCNAIFLQHLPEIHRHARSTSFVNCMTWNFPKEIEMQAKGFIDFHLYQSSHCFHRVSGKLRNHGEYRPLAIQPYFRVEDFQFHDDRPSDKFRFGRISRGDPAKFNPRQLWIYETMTAPVSKEGIILGWNDRVHKRFGREPDNDILALPEGAIPQSEFYEHCEAVIMSTDTFENLPRVGFEAMASGSILIVDDRGGWRLQVEDGRTGWLCKDHLEFVHKASRCAFSESERSAMRAAAREKLLGEWGLQASMDSWAQVFARWQELR